MTLPLPLWRDMTTDEIAKSGRSRWIAVLPIAALEQHGPHLPLSTDTAIAEAHLSRVLALMPLDLPATILPVVWAGTSHEHVSFPGTISLSPATLTALLTDIGDSLARSGIKKLVIINSHGGNNAVMDIVARDLRLRHGMLVVFTSWHRFGPPPGLFSDEEKLYGIHGGAYETSVMLAAEPQNVRKDKVKPFPSLAEELDARFSRLKANQKVAFGWLSEDLNKEGAMGDASKASVEAGEACLDHSARAFVEFLREVDAFDPATLGTGHL